MSTEQTHTPGPWKVNETVQMTSSVYIFADRNFACVYDEWQDRSIMDANARLIAAAPDLLEALKATWAVLDAAGLMTLSFGVQIGGTAWYLEASDVKQQARAAIAKAEGNA